MNRKRSQLQAYFAGIVDGEGHIGIRHNDTTYGARVHLQMDDPQALLMIWREYPEATINYRQHTTGKPFYEVRFSHYKSERFLRDCLPFLLVKHQQAKVALSFLAHRRQEHFHLGARGNKDCGRCERLCAALLALRAADKKVNSVNALLEHELREYRAKPEDVADDVAVISAKVTELLEGLETRLRSAQTNKTISAFEQDIVQEAA